jgi:hypothetical protein
MLRTLQAKKTSLGFAAALTLLGSACGGLDDATPDFDCDAESLPGEYIRQTGGTYPASDLHARSEAAEGIDIAALGLLNVDFNFWKETVDTVPFDPPANIVCEVLTFAGADGARAFLAALQPAGDSLAATSITWPLDAEFLVQEVAINGGSEPRTFVATEQEGARRTLISLFAVEGSQVHAVHAGGEEMQLAPEQLVPALRSINAVP